MSAAGTPDPATVAAVIEAIDAANAQDPRRRRWEDRGWPLELLHAHRMTHWLMELDPEADAAQRVAARGHHFRRWTRPRGDYPEGRAGYLRWRRDARRAHATELAGLMADRGCDQGFIDRVGTIVRKEGLGRDPHVQTHEDALCLVFLEQQFDETLDRLGHERLVDVLRATLPKMSRAGIDRAMQLPFSDAARAVLGEASGS